MCTHIEKRPEQRSQNFNLLQDIWLIDKYECSHFQYEYKITGYSKPIVPRKSPDMTIPETLWDHKG